MVVLAASPRYRALLECSLALRAPVESLRANLAGLPEMLSLWVRPWALSVDHGFDPRGASAVGGAVLVGAMLVTAWVARRRAPMVTLAVAWVLVALAPTNSVIAKLDVVTEKPLYLAWVGVSLGLGALAGRIGRAAAPVVAAVVVAGVVFASARVVVWQDARTLWADAAAKAPGNGRAWNNLGMAHVAAGERGKARAAFVRAVRVDPDDVDARRNLARVDDPYAW